MLQDLRYAARQLWQVPGYSIVAVLTLAVGIGATTAVFSVVNAVLLRPVHAPAPDAIVRFIVTSGVSTSVAGVREFDAWRRAPAFEQVSAHRMEYVNVPTRSEPQQIAEAIPRIGAGAAAVTVDWRVCAFAVVTCVSTATICGLWPGLTLGRIDVATAMKAGTGGFGRRHTRRRDMLVVGEVALALMLLVGAMLLIRSSVALRAVNPGFDPNNVITTRTSVTSTRFETRAGLSELTRLGLEQLRSLPGVLSASATCCMPLETVWQLPFIVEGRPPESLTRAGRLTYTGFAGWTFIAPGYFDVLKVPILRGRDFTNADRAGASGVVLINEEMARRFWPSRDPIGDRLIIGKGMRPEYDDEPVAKSSASSGTCEIPR
jgi:hypothetical protein